MKIAVTDVRYFTRSKFLSLFHKNFSSQEFWLYMIITFQVRIRILSMELAFLFQV